MSPVPPTSQLSPQRPPSGPAWRCVARAVVALGLGLGSTPATPGATAIPASPEVARKPFSFAFSQRMFSDVNENDAQASVRAWALALSKERSIHLEAKPIIIPGATQLNAALREGTVDGAAILTTEFLDLDHSRVDPELFISIIDGRIDEEYLLLVRGPSAYRTAVDLKGRELGLHANPRTSLAPAWLARLLEGLGAPPPERHFSRVISAPRIAKVLLPVFFGQRDACVVTRKGFETMCDMNPQVRTQLRILATSPPVVPAIGLFRAGLPPEQRAEMIRAMRNLEDSASGRQVLTLFQTTGLIETNDAALTSARELLGLSGREIPGRP